MSVIHDVLERLGLTPGDASDDDDPAREWGFVLLVEACLARLERGSEVSCHSMVAALSSPSLPVSVRADALERLVRLTPPSWLWFVLAQVARRFPPGDRRALDSVPPTLQEALIDAIDRPDPAPWLVEAMGVLGDACLPHLMPHATVLPLDVHLAMAARHCGPARWKLLYRNPNAGVWATLRESGEGRPIPYRAGFDTHEPREWALEALAEEWLRDSGERAADLYEELTASELECDRELARHLAGRIDPSLDSRESQSGAKKVHGGRASPVTEEADVRQRLDDFNDGLFAYDKTGIAPETLLGLLPSLEDDYRHTALYLAAHSPAALPEISAIARSWDVDERRRAARLLGVAGEEAFDLVCTLAIDPAPSVRADAAEAVVQQGDRARGFLRALAADVVDEVRAATCRALRLAPAHADVLDILGQLTLDPDPGVRTAALTALARVDPLTQTEQLEMGLADLDHSDARSLMRGLAGSRAPLLPFIAAFTPAKPHHQRHAHRLRRRMDWGLPGHLEGLFVPPLGEEDPLDPPRALPVDGDAGREALIRHLEQQRISAGCAMRLLADPAATREQRERVLDCLAVGPPDRAAWVLSRLAVARGFSHPRPWPHASPPASLVCAMSDMVDAPHLSTAVRRAACRALGLLGDLGTLVALVAQPAHANLHTAAVVGLGVGGEAGWKELLDHLDRARPHIQHVVLAILAQTPLTEEEDLADRAANLGSTQARAFLTALSDRETRPCAPSTTRGVEEALARYSRASDPSVRAYTATQFADLGATGIPGLETLGKDEHWSVRKAAARAAGRLGEPGLRVLEPLGGDEEDRVRAQVALAVGLVGEAAEPILRALATDDSLAVRTCVAQSLWRIGPLGRPILDELAREDSWGVQKAVASSLCRLGPDALPALGALLATDSRAYWKNRFVASSVSALGDSCLPILQRFASDRDAHSRRAAATALGRIGASALPLLGRLALTRDVEVRAEVARSLAKLAPRRTATLVRLASDGHDAVSFAAVPGLAAAAAGNDALLRSLLRSPSWGPRAAAAVALEARGDDDDPVFLRIVRHSRDPVRVALAEALARQGRLHRYPFLLQADSPSALRVIVPALARSSDGRRPVLREILDEGSIEVVDDVSRTLSHLLWDQLDPDRLWQLPGWDTPEFQTALLRMPLPHGFEPVDLVRPFICRAPDAVGIHAARLLGTRGRDTRRRTEAWKLLEAMSGDRSPAVRGQVARELASRPDEALARLTILADTDDAHVSLTVALALKHLGEEGLDLLGRLTCHPDEEVRIAAIQSLGSKGPSGIGLLAAAAQDSSESVRLNVARIATGLGDSTVHLLDGLAGDEEPDVREAVATACSQLGTAAIEILGRLAGDEETAVREIVAKALGDCGAQGMPFLERLVQDDNRGVREHATRALGRIGEPALPLLVSLATDPPRDDLGGFDLPIDLFASLRALSARPQPYSRPLLESDTRAAIEALGEVGRAAIPTLERLLLDDRAAKRVEAASALVQAAPDQTGVLERMARADDDEIRRFAFDRLRATRAEPSLRALAEDGRSELCEAALDALCDCDVTPQYLLDRQAVTPGYFSDSWRLGARGQRALELRRPDPADRAAAWLLLARLAPTRAFADLENTHDTWFEGIADTPLVLAGPGHGPALALAARFTAGSIVDADLCTVVRQDPRRWMRRIALVLLGRSDTPPEPSWWRDRMEAERVPGLRFRIFETRVRLEGPEVALAALACDPLPRIRRRAVALLARMGSVDAGPALAAAARADRDAEVRTTAVNALERRRDTEAVWTLLDEPGRTEPAAIGEVLNGIATRVERLTGLLGPDGKRYASWLWSGDMDGAILVARPVLDVALAHGLVAEDIARRMAALSDSNRLLSEVWQEDLWGATDGAGRRLGILEAGVVAWCEEEEVSRVIHALRLAAREGEASLAQAVIRLVEDRWDEKRAFQDFRTRLLSGDVDARTEALVDFGSRWEGANLRPRHWRRIARRAEGPRAGAWVQRIWRCRGLEQGMALLRAADPRRRPRQTTERRRPGAANRAARRTGAEVSIEAIQPDDEFSWLFHPTTPAQQVVAILKGLQDSAPPTVADLPGAAEALGALHRGGDDEADAEQALDPEHTDAPRAGVLARLRESLTQPIDDPQATAAMISRAFDRLGMSSHRGLALNVGSAHPGSRGLVRWLSCDGEEEDLALKGPMVSTSMSERMTDDKLEDIEYGDPVLGTRLLNFGAGTLAAPDYPVIHLTCRPGVRAVSEEMALQLAQLEGVWQGDLARLDEARSMADILSLDETEALDEALESLDRDVRAWCTLRHVVFAGDPHMPIRRKHLRRFWRRAERLEDPVPETLSDTLHAHGRDGLIAGIVGALQIIVRSPADADHPLHSEAGVRCLRRVAALYRAPDGDEDHPAAIADRLFHAVHVAPQEAAEVIGLAPGVGLPTLSGGARTPWEHQVSRALHAAMGGHMGVEDDAPLRRFELRPLGRLESLSRGDLGGDCSSHTVPLRALLPHRTYYGVYEDGVQQRGYIGVFEAVADVDSGRFAPVLCLETVNVPMREFDSVQLDLLTLFEAVARQRGLEHGLVLATGRGTWNYANEQTLTWTRRFRQGRQVYLDAIDPAVHAVYEQVTDEAGVYDSTYSEQTWLAPFQPGVDVVLPENLAEARRIENLPRADEPPHSI